MISDQWLIIKIELYCSLFYFSSFQIPHQLFSSSNLFIFKSSHHLIILSSHHHIILSSHHHIILSSHHHIISSSHHLIITSSHYHIILSSHHLIITLSHHLIILSSHHLIITSSFFSYPPQFIPMYREGLGVRGQGFLWRCSSLPWGAMNVVWFIFIFLKMNRWIKNWFYGSTCIILNKDLFF